VARIRVGEPETDPNDGTAAPSATKSVRGRRRAATRAAYRRRTAIGVAALTVCALVWLMVAQDGTGPQAAVKPPDLAAPSSPVATASPARSAPPPTTRGPVAAIAGGQVDAVPAPSADPGSARPPAGHSPATLPLTVGTALALEPITDPGYRVRHRNFIGRIDPVSSTSSALDKADSTFVTRTGLAATRCVSFESVNYPGYFLRHQNFQVYLQRFDGRPQFAFDATFCPVAGLGGRDVSLRSYNYPSRYVHHRNRQLYLDEPDRSGTTAAAMTFAVRAAF
jgi:hypothetical protein